MFACIAIQVHGDWTDGFADDSVRAITAVFGEETLSNATQQQLVNRAITLRMLLLNIAHLHVTNDLLHCACHELSTFITIHFFSE